MASAIDAKCPKITFDDFVHRVKQIEEKYTHWNKINKRLTEFKSKYIDIFNILKERDVVTNLQEIDLRELRGILSWFIEKGYVSIQETHNVTMTPEGLFKRIVIKATREYRSLFCMEECTSYRK